jgi:hypothetical protein
VYAKRTEDSDYLAQEEPGVRTTIVKNHKERSKFGAEVSVLKSGDKFGDLCFYKSNNERNATVIADENLHLLVVDCKVYQVLLADKFLDMKDQLRFMEKSPLFKGTVKLFPSHVSRRWTNQETLFPSHVSQRWTNQEALFPSHVS